MTIGGGSGAPLRAIAVVPWTIESDDHSHPMDLSRTELRRAR
jgi:hypothetical protein